MAHYQWIQVVRTAERLLSYEPTSDAAAMARKSILRDLEALDPDAFRAVVRAL